MDFQKLDGLIPAVVQDDESGEVLMVGFMNPEALDRTIATGYATFFSRTRRRLWTKGETSGNRLLVRALLADCDEDTLLVRVLREGDGQVCHTGERSCFFRQLDVRVGESGVRSTANGSTSAQVEQPVTVSGNRTSRKRHEVTDGEGRRFGGRRA